MKRAVLYARVSGDDRKYATSGIESQLVDCRKYAIEQEYQVVSERYEMPDKATSGADWLPEIEHVLKLAQNNTFDVLVVREVDRLARNRFKQMAIETELAAHDVLVEYVIGRYEDSAEGRLLKGLMSEFAEYEREKTKQRTQRGSLRSVAAGNVIIGGSYAPYGYEVVQQNGKRTLAINETEAKIVHIIYDLYLNGLYTTYAIADYLTDNKIPKASKGRNHKARTSRNLWAVNTVTGILKNETYIGRWYYRKTKREKSGNGKIKHVPRPRSEWLLVEVPAVLPEDTWKAAQDRMKANKRQTGRRRNRVYALSGVFNCSRCGSGIVGVSRTHGENDYSYYKCAARHSPKRYGHNCDMPTTRIEKLDAIVWSWVKDVVLSPPRLREQWENHTQQRLEQLRPLMSTIETNKARLAQVEEEKRRLVKAYAAGALTLDDITEEKTRVEKLINELGKGIAALEADLEPRMPRPEEMETIEQYAGRIRQGATLSDDDPQEQQELFRLLQMKGTLSHDGAIYWLDLSCILGERRLSTVNTTAHRNETGSANARAGGP